MTTQQQPDGRPIGSPEAFSHPRHPRPAPDAMRVGGGYYDPDSAAFDDIHGADFETLLKSTAPVRPVPTLVRSGA